MKKVEINTEALENIISKLDEKFNNVSNIFDEIDKKMLMLDGTSDVWQSNAQASVYKNYKTISDGFPNINEQLTDYLTFLRKTVENYKSGEKIIDDSINSNEKDLKVI